MVLHCHCMRVHAFLCLTLSIRSALSCDRVRKCRTCREGVAITVQPALHQPAQHSDSSVQWPQGEVLEGSPAEGAPGRAVDGRRCHARRQCGRAARAAGRDKPLRSGRLRPGQHGQVRCFFIPCTPPVNICCVTFAGAAGGARIATEASASQGQLLAPRMRMRCSMGTTCVLLL